MNNLSKKHDGFSSHLVQRFFERYNKLISKTDIERFNVLIKNAPSLKYTSIKYFIYENIKVYCYIKQNNIVTFLTEKQALNSQKQRESEKDKPNLVFNKPFNVGELWPKN